VLGTLKRERGATTAHATVTCKAGVGESGGAAPAGELALYDGDGTFSMEVGDPSRRDDDRSELEDAKTSDQDKTPGCRLSSAGPPARSRSGTRRPPMRLSSSCDGG